MVWKTDKVYLPQMAAINSLGRIQETDLYDTELNLPTKAAWNSK